MNNIVSRHRFATFRIPFILGPFEPEFFYEFNFFNGFFQARYSYKSEFVSPWEPRILVNLNLRVLSNPNFCGCPISILSNS